MERDFKGIWIPKEIWLNKDLSPLEKIILAEIDSLDTEEYDGCIAGNEYLAEFCQCSMNKVALAVSKLKGMGFIELVSFDGRTRRLKSRLNVNQRQTLKKSKADFEEEKTINIADKIKDKIKDNYNNDSLQGVNKVDRVKNNRFVPPTIEEIKMFCNERNNGVDAKRVFDYYSSANWKDGRGNPVKNWKQKIIAVWEKNNDNKVAGRVAHGNDDYNDDFDMERYIEERRKRG